MSGRQLVAGVVFSAMLLLGAGGGAMARHEGGHGGDGPNCTPAVNGMGIQISHAAQKWGGIAEATAHHNAMHPEDQLSIGEHQQMILDTCWVHPQTT